MPDELWAEVCVNTPLGRQVGPSLGADKTTGPEGRTFTYHVPQRFAERLAAGHLVWVPFRSRRLQGVVLGLTSMPPEFDTADIEGLVWAQPVLTEAQLDLARWISTYYLSPLIEALRLMLPAHISQRGRTVFVRTPEPVSMDLSPSQAALLAAIAEGEGTWPEVSEGLKVTQKADLEPLIAAGLVAREVAFATPPPRPKVNRRVRLLVDAPAVAQALPALGRPSHQADVLAWLAAQEEPLPAVADLCAALGCTPGSLKALAERNLVTLPPARVLVRRTVPDADLPGVLRSLAHATKRSSALSSLPTHFVEERGYRVEHGADLATLRWLAEQGLIERAEEPAQIGLAIEREAVNDAIVKLRNAEKHRQVLEALIRHGEPAWIGWVYAETDAALDTLRDLEAAGLVSIEEEVVWRDPLGGREFRTEQPPELTADQANAWTTVKAGMPRDSAFLLFGVTGSGKTEIYLRAIEEVLQQGQQAVVLVPEIALTPQTVQRFASRFPGRVTVWHSGLGEGERFDVWRRVRTGYPGAQVVVGSRSALFLPFPRLGLAVVDEEHETTYKQERTPRYHARTVALQYGRLARFPVLLGSATPALESYYAARTGAIQLVNLPRRVLAATPPAAVTIGEAARAAGEPKGLPLQAALPLHGDLPGVQLVDMRQELRVGNRTMFSRVLSQALKRILDHKQQAILYLNRRGSASFVMCRDCGHVESCPRCAVPLTYHGTGNLLVCHHCNRRYPVPAVCPECGSRRIRYFGSGTQNVEEAVQQAFPGVRTLRWDRDVTGARGAHDAILAQFSSHGADVLIGTQMIAKGLDLPLVTLVGVIAADTGLFLPDFRAGERTFQLLTQVAGRAGRSALGGQVIIQTYHPDHYAIVAATHHDFESFYRQEMAFRREQGYPPLRRLARLVYQHSQRDRAQSETTALAARLAADIQASGLPDTDLIGPAPCFFAQQRGEYRWQVVVRAPDPSLLLGQLALEPGWRLDIDPTDLL